MDEFPHRKNANGVPTSRLGNYLISLLFIYWPCHGTVTGSADPAGTAQPFTVA
jgi:hypothetical protein